MRILIFLFLIILSGCAVSMQYFPEEKKVVGKGWGFKSGEILPDGTVKIEKEEPIRTPDILPQR